ncbi:EAL domain protein [compost metagenome]
MLEGAGQLARQLGLPVLGWLQKPACAMSMRSLLEKYLQQVPGQESGARGGANEDALDPEVFQPQHLKQTMAQWVVHYQPKVCFEGNLAGVEALVRWQHPRLGLLWPGHFLPMVEQAGLLETLTWHVLDRALALSAQHRKEKAAYLPVAVNIAPQLLECEDFTCQVTTALDRHGVPAGVLTLEVIESQGCRIGTQQLEGLLRLRLLGCQLSIDDFGTGESNLQRLLEMPFSELKLPSEFVRGMAEDGRKAAIVAGALMMARRMDLKVVVEGVETVEDLLAIKALGNPIMQGYFIARPMAASQLMHWIAKREGTVCPQAGTA